LQTVTTIAHDTAVMAKLERSRLATALEHSQSGGGVRFQEVDQLKDFADFARVHDCVVCNVETYELRGEAEIARLELSIFAGGEEEQTLPDAERVQLSEKSLQEVLAAIEAEVIACVFQVWTDRL
jgi:hypothetical protein